MPVKFSKSSFFFSFATLPATPLVDPPQHSTPEPTATAMACQCRTAALQIFVRSLAQVHAPKTPHVRSAWIAAHPRLPSRNNSVPASYRRAYSSLGASNPVAEEGHEQRALPEEQHEPQSEQDPASTSEPSAAAGSTAENNLFSIKLRSKNAIRKASRYAKHSELSPPPEDPGLAKEKRKRVKKSWDNAEKRTEGITNLKKTWDRNGKRTEQDERRAKRAKDQEPKVDERPDWAKQKQALKQKFPDGWRPPKRLSPDALEGIRVLHQQFPDMYTTEALAAKFEVSPEAIRRILKAKWEPTAEEDEDRQRRWFNRGVSVWQRYAELGRQPPRRWREAGVEASPWTGATSREGHAEEVDVGVKVDRETATRLQAQRKLSKSLL